MVVLCVAGARLENTSKVPVPETLAVESRKKWNSHSWPAVEAGKSKVRSVVTSVVLPFLKILPLLVLKWTAPVQTSYWERTVGRMMFGWPNEELALVDAVDVLAVLVVDTRKVVFVVF